jgi:RimJ/RimL family protein N-acetyltransferase
MLGPNLEGRCVRLEPPRPEHLPSFVRWFADPEVTRYLYRRWPPSLHQEERWLERMARSEEDLVWAVLRTRGAALVGVLAFHRLDWHDRHAWIEIVLGERSAWGQGHASEATRLGLRYAFRELGLEKVLASVYSGHAASLTLAQRVGFRPCGLFRRHTFFDGAWHDEWVGEILRDEWQEPAGAPVAGGGWA